MLRKEQSRHSQISEWLRDKIAQGDYAIDEKLPSENELAEKFSVSRVTVRRALQTLESENMIYRCQGLGSFVGDNRSRQLLVRLTDFSEDMSRAGMESRSEVITFEQVRAPEWLADRLSVEEGTLVTRIDRLRKGSGEPVAFDMTWMPVFYGQLLDGMDLRDMTIYRILEEEYSIPIIKGCYQIQSENADSYIAEQLKVEEGKALLLFHRHTFTVREKPVYFQKRYYNSDKVSYELLLERDPADMAAGGELPLREIIPVFRNDDG